MRKPPLKHRLGQKLLSWSHTLLGWRTTIYEDPNEAPPTVTPAFLDALRRVPTVAACVTRKSYDMSRVPLVVGYRTKSGERKPAPPSDEVAMLFASINPTEGPASFRARSYAMKMLTGDLFWQLEYGGKANPQEMWLLRSDRMTVKKGETRRPTGYEYDVHGTGQILKLDPKQVFHSRLPNPSDDWRGLSQLASSSIFAWIEEKIGRHHLELLEQGGVPPGWLAFPGYVSPEDRAELRSEIRKRHQGIKSKYQLGILWDGAGFVRGADGAREGDFDGLTDLAREEICSVFGVPPIFVMNLEHASYANAVQQKELYWQNTLVPELEMDAQDLEETFRRVFGRDDLTFWYDYDRVAAIQDLRLVRAEALQRLVAGGLYTQNEARLELGKPKATGGDALYFPQALQPTGTVVAVPAPARAHPAFGTKAWLDDPDRHAKRDENARSLASFVPEVERTILALEHRVEALVVANTLKGTRAVGSKDRLDEIDWEAVRSEYATTLGRAYVQVAGLRGQAALDGVVDDGIFDLTVPGVTEWVETVAGEQSKLIVGTMRDELRTILAESFDETDTERAKRIREHFNVRRDHANTIAWTESGKAYNFGTLEGFRQSGVVAKKEWLAILDEHTRDAHRDADGQVVGLDEFFLVDGELIQFPGAPGATAENSINCRCAMQPVVDQDLKAARIARKRSRVVVLAAELDELFAEPSTNGH